MLVELRPKDNGEIGFFPVQPSAEMVDQSLIDNMIEHTALEEVYTDVETKQLSEDYEQYHGTEEIIVGEVALLLNTFVENLKRDGYIIARGES